MTSLRRRLLLSTLVGSVILTLTTGLFLSVIFSISTEKQFDQRLQTTLTELVGATVITNNQVELSLRQLGPQFSNLYSGWYWQIVENNQTKSLFKSQSLHDSSLISLLTDDIKNQMAQNRQDVSNFYFVGPVQNEIRVYAQYISFPELKEPLLYIVSGNSRILSSEARSFYWMIATGLSLLVAGLTLGTYFQLRFVLKPLEHLKNYLAKIRIGEGKSIEAELPQELMPVVNEINNLVAANEQVIERARTHVGNLAHALKTPLSVLLNASDNKLDENSKLVKQQVGLMNVQVAHHLNRARMIASHDTVATKIQVSPIVNSIVNALKKINFDKNVKVDLKLEDEICFYGERQDLEELIGNLIDNAFKWCNRRVSIAIGVAQIDNQQKLHIIVEDDGPFMPAQELKKVMQRGHRIDENMIGSGLGLSIVKELTELYKGKFTLSKSQLAGLKAELWLPMA
ncbi:MAG: GHKL domain-containing protein [Rhizobiales bacterium]|nr:ATP-binding protein [Hyphomicrobiales bacterium]NRB13378.1 GHKL domain-containing protein [Hyphomicrobiales bacterium]